MPHAVHDAPPGQHVAFVGQPARERGTARRFFIGIGDEEFRRQSGNAGERARPDQITRFVQFAAREQVDRPRFWGWLEALALWREIPRRRIDQLRSGQRGHGALVFLLQYRQSQRLPLHGRALLLRHSQQIHQLHRRFRGGGHDRHLIAGREAEPADSMPRRSVLKFQP